MFGCGCTWDVTLNKRRYKNRRRILVNSPSIIFPQNFSWKLACIAFNGSWSIPFVFLYLFIYFSHVRATRALRLFWKAALFQKEIAFLIRLDLLSGLFWQRRNVSNFFPERLSDTRKANVHLVGIEFALLIRRCVYASRSFLEPSYYEWKRFSIHRRSDSLQSPESNAQIEISLESTVFSALPEEFTSSRETISLERIVVCMWQPRMLWHTRDGRRLPDQTEIDRLCVCNVCADEVTQCCEKLNGSELWRPASLVVVRC